MELEEFRELYVRFIDREDLLEIPELLEMELKSDDEWEFVLSLFHEEEKRKPDQKLTHEEAGILLRAYKEGYNSGCRSGVKGKSHQLYD